MALPQIIQTALQVADAIHKLHFGLHVAKEVSKAGVKGAKALNEKVNEPPKPTDNKKPK